MKALREWGIARFSFTVLVLLLFAFLCGQVAGAGQFDSSLRIGARVLQILLGMLGLWIVFAWASARDKRHSNEPSK